MFVRWEADPLVLQMPWTLKTRWHEQLKPLVEEWIGGIELVSAAPMSHCFLFFF